MNIDYFITYGFFDLNMQDSIQNFLMESFNLEFDERQSDYLGKYLVSKKNLFDKCTIEKNFVDFLEDYKEKNHTNYEGLVKFSIIKGDPNDKMKLRDQVIKVIELKYPSLHLIRSREIS